MVTAVTTFGRSGLSDWLIQRFSAVVLAGYTVFLTVFLLLNPELTYEVWADLYSQLWMRVFTLLVLISCAAHGWIGLWGVLTDYFTTRLIGGGALAIRMVVLTVYALITLTYMVWGVEILWGF